jgi:hypothetical protein
MKNSKNYIQPFFIVIIALVCLMFITAVHSQDLPPRPTATPTPMLEAQPVGARIQLTMSSAAPLTAGTWTAVQWQDPHTGDWHFVDGWQGHPNNSQQVTWWVAPADLGSGPFRWLVFADASQTLLLHTTDSFDLPAGAGQLVAVTAVMNNTVNDR